MAELVKTEGTSPVMGMNLSDDPQSIKEGEVTFALNAFIKNGKYRTLRANKFIKSLPAGFMYLHDVKIDSDNLLLFLVNPITNVSQIGIFVNDNYTPKITDIGLGFRIDKPIQAQIKKSYKGEVIVYYTDNNKPMRRINITNPPLISGVLDTTAIDIYQDYVIPNIRIQSVTNNGALLSGTYFVIGQYADANGNALTAAFTPVGPIPIVKDSIGGSYDFIEGSLSNIETDKAINLIITNIDTSFQYLNIIIVKQTDGVKQAYLVDTISTGQNTYIINGTGNVPIVLDLTKILQPPTVYETAKTVTPTNDLLLWGNLTSAKIDNLQPFFNNVQVQWQVERWLANDTSNNHVNPINSVYKKTFRFGEAYSIGINIIYTKGHKSQTYIFPGRKKNKKADGSTITNTTDQYGNIINGWDTANTYSGTDVTEQTDQSKQRWELFNTAYIAGSDLAGNVGKAEYGELAYFETINTYPNNVDIWGDLAGQPMRFHKMPDQSVINLHDGLNGAKIADDLSYLNFLGIRLNNIEEVIASLPLEVRNKMQGWEIVVSDRTYNKTVIASGLMYNTLYSNWNSRADTFQSLSTNDLRVYNNYPFNDLSEDHYIFKAPIANDVPSRTVGNDRYKRNIFSFVSPDTFYSKPVLNNGIMRIFHEKYGVASETFNLIKPYPRLHDVDSSSPDDSAFGTYAVGWYNNYKNVGYGNTVRKLKDGLYIPANIQTSTGNIGIPIDNITRESTVIIGFNIDLQNTSIVDNSRAQPSRDGLPCDGGVIGQGFHFERTASSYYGSIIKPNESQYGNVFNIKYYTTNYNHYNVVNNSIIFGGDTFIGRFSLKRQLMFFKNAQDYVGTADGTRGIDLKYKETIPNTNFYYYDSADDSNGICSGRGGRDLGLIPVIYTGVPVFYTESDDNINYRLNGQVLADTFYKNLQNGAISLEEWLGIKNVDKDNYNILNKDLSIKNDLTTYDSGNPSYDPNIEKALEHYGRVIYSLSSSSEDIFDNWAIYLPLNYYDFPKNEGAIWDMRYVGMYKTLFRLENGVFMDELYTQIATDRTSLNLGNGKLFEKKPLKMATTDNNYSGTHSQFVFNNTPVGSFFIDDLLGVPYVFSDGLKPIAGANIYWFQENLPLILRKQIQGLNNVDNAQNPNSIGYLSQYDYDDHIWFLTKKDYAILPSRNPLLYTYVNGRFYYNNIEVFLSDVTYFINKSFTIGYMPLMNSWITFTSFLPNGYFTLKNTMYSLKNGADTKIYAHNDDRKSSSYYGINYPHIIELFIKNTASSSMFDLFYSFQTKAFKKVAGQFVEQLDNTFNKAIVYNSLSCSGLLELIIQDEDDLSSIFNVYEQKSDRRTIALRKASNTFSFNEIYDLVNSINNKQGFFSNDWNLIKDNYFIDKVLDNSKLDYAREYNESAELQEIYTLVRLILDNNNDIQLTTYFAYKDGKVTIP